MKTRSTKPIIPDSSKHDYVEFTTSNLAEDGGQTTIPFLDSREVTTQPPAPLSGISLIHLGQKGLGGVVSFKLNVFNFAYHYESYLLPPDENSAIDRVRDGLVIKVRDV